MRSLIPLIFLVFFLLSTVESVAQAPLRPAKAAAYSIALPGLGHRYANGNKWNRRAALYTIADAVLLAGLVTSEWQRGQLVQSYQSWAASYAGVSTTGKDRRFYVTIGNHLSSHDYREAQLRSRRVDLVSYVDDPAFQWAWTSERDFQRYRNLRGDAESWAQRRGSFIAALVANRLISAVSALLTTRRKRESSLQVAVTPGPTLKLALTL
ncbi:MAG: hypothetical protein OXD43_08295 [Bacteroidetes bacterium]|nr:hypothetical protein [Bacteroidota bacterium]